MSTDAQTILLVDDEAGIRKVLGIVLSDLGYRVLTAANADEALQLFDRERPEIVLTDIKMPGRDGLSLLSDIKRICPDTEIIVITGHGELELAIRSLKLEVADFVTKPIRDDILEMALKRARDRITMRRQLRDYTENLERLVAEKAKKLVSAERMAAIGETVAGMSHTIKNIAGGLKGGVYVLEKGLTLEDKNYLRQGWEMVRGNVEKITNLSMDLLNYSKTGDISMELCDPNQPARDAARLMTTQMTGKRVAFEMEWARGLTPVFMDAEGIQRCLLNVLANALDACTQEESAREGKRIRLRTLAEPGWGVTYQVSDNGCGMDDSVQAGLFQRFFTTKGTRGTGIGLMLTKKIIEAHRGEIRVASEKGKGTSFVIRLPRVTKASVNDVAT
ncbi:MAG: response regulator [Desulfobacterales bacterium]|jgi:signal transduction histidine kinase|nr:response regulator [Desulfobacterales bacterium]